MITCRFTTWYLFSINLLYHTTLLLINHNCIWTQKYTFHMLAVELKSYWTRQCLVYLITLSGKKYNCLHWSVIAQHLSYRQLSAMLNPHQSASSQGRSVCMAYLYNKREVCLSDRFFVIEISHRIWAKFGSFGCIPK